MKILLAGNWRWMIYEEAFGQALAGQGWQVIKFSFATFFDGKFGRIQEAIPVPGPALIKLNKSILKKAKAEKPDVALIWRGTHIHPRTIREMNRMGITTVSYNNDDPFGPKNHVNVPWHHHLLWHWYLKGIRRYRINFFFRKVNVMEAVDYGARNASVLKPYFVPWKDRPVDLSPIERKNYECDVVFIGHYEPDGRVKYLRALVESGFRVRLFGDEYWRKDVLGDLSSYFGEIRRAEDDSYAKALCGAKICLAFFSKLNRDTYTRRCFEIPACGRLMLAERTDDLGEMFEENKEACYFSSCDELIKKVQWLISNPEISENIAKAGMKRVWSDGHDVESRASQFINAIKVECTID